MHKLHSNPNPAMTYNDFMQIALDLAQQAAAAGEVPVGAIVVKDGEIIVAAVTPPSRHMTRQRMPR